MRNEITSFTVEISDIALPESYGVAKKDGLVIFVPECVPGDQANIRIVRKGKNAAYGELLRIKDPSPFRIEPACPSFSVCGGCTMQNLSYEKQLQVKESHVKETLRRIGGLDPDNLGFSSIVPSPMQFHYRSKVELSFGENKNDVILGMKKRAVSSEHYKWDVAPVGRCLVFCDKTEEIIKLFEEYANRHNLPSYSPFKKRGLMKHLILREAKSTGEIMAIIETASGDLPETEILWKALIRKIPHIKSLYRIINDYPGDVIRYEKTYHLFGKLYIEDTLGGLTFRIYPESFFQPNPIAATLLYKKIAELTRTDKNKTVLGLYCGIAPIEIFISNYAKNVIGIDISRINIMNAKENCRINGILNCSFYQGKVEDKLKKTRLNDMDIVVVDPPREGISKEGLHQIYKIKPKNVAYVSCNPSTLARDLRDFRKNGYKTIHAIPFDFFPHTSHIETLAILEKI